MKRLRGGLVLKARRLLHHSIVGSGVMKKKIRAGPHAVIGGDPQSESEFSTDGCNSQSEREGGFSRRV